MAQKAIIITRKNAKESEHSKEEKVIGTRKGVLEVFKREKSEHSKEEKVIGTSLNPMIHKVFEVV